MAKHKAHSRPHITAETICDLLAARHAKDVYVPQCKTGATWMSRNMQILDGWAMTRSWVKWSTFGYEIKISRGDFLADEKWMGYLPYCHEFYFVCPTGVIDPVEVPEQTGLLYVSRTGTKLFRKRKAPRRDVDIPQDILVYLLMCRTHIQARHTQYSGEEPAAQYWRQWLARKDENKELGYRVSQRIRKIVREKITAVNAKNRDLEARMRSYDKVTARMAALGLDPANTTAWGLDRQAERAAERVLGVVPHATERAVAEAVRHLTILQKAIEELKTRHGGQDGNEVPPMPA